ncbi:MAG: RsmD family RNA methyltransferase, partial [Duncaniella sp.]|nr:RsmD family RNA methyltransferase [Duncaniella sp.]
DYNSLRLKHHGDPLMMERILQQECREKCAKKLSLTLSNPDFRFPSTALAEMCTSDEVAEIHASMVPARSSILDMTAGLGIDVIHFANHGNTLTAIEMDRHSAQVLRDNISLLNLTDRVDVICADSISWLDDNNRHYDVIFIDPARRDASGRHFSFSQCVPDITSCIQLLRSRCEKLIIKASPMVDIDAALTELGNPQADIAIIGTDKECKEVVFEIRETASGAIRCITVGHNEYVTDPHSTPAVTTAVPSPGQWLGQPYPSIMKAGGKIDGFSKLHPNTHLYLSDNFSTDFPGQQFRIKEVIPFSNKEIRRIAKDYPTINVAVRNFPLSAPQLVSRLKVKEGGDLKLFGTTLHDGVKVLIITEMKAPID